jgi:hypothetical protein
MTLQALPISSPGRYLMVARPRPRPSTSVGRPLRPKRPLTGTQPEGTPLYRLFGVAVLGWFGVMVMVVLLAV